MKKARWLAAILLLAPARCGAARWWWNTIPDRWTDKPIAVQAKDGGWFSDEVFDEAGLNFRAMNDAANLYLLIMADGRDGRALLSGAFRQDLTIWFYGPDRKSKAWGILCPFSRLGPPEPGAVDEIESLGAAPSMPALVPETVFARGPEVSTAAFSSDVDFSVGLSGKNPVFVVRVPLAKVGPARGRRLPLDFTVAKVDPEVEQRLRSLGPKKQNADSSDGRSRRRPPSDAGDPSRAGRVMAPEAMNLQLSLRLAKDPAAK